MLDHAEIIEGRLIVQSISYDHGILTFGAVKKSDVIRLQKELISTGDYDKAELDNFESDSFGEAFDYCDYENSVSIYPVQSPKDLRQYAKQLTELAELLESDKDLILTSS